MRRSAVARLAFVLALPVVTLGEGARAEGPEPIDQLAAVTSTSRLTLDAGVALGLPATWQTGLSTGAGAGASYGRTFAFGARASWSTSTESSLAWTVRHDDIRLRLTGAVQRAVGRGSFALRLGIGPTLVLEDRVRSQGARAGLTGGALETSTTSTMPAAEVEAVVGLHVGGPWLAILSGGPSLLVSDGAWHGGWTAQVGVGWQP